MYRISFSWSASSFFLLTLLSLFQWNRSYAAINQQRYSSWIETADLAECQNKILRLSNTFTTKLGVSVLDQRCGTPVQLRNGHVTKTFIPLSLTYTSSEPIAFTHAQFGSDISWDQPGTYIGAFTDLEHCQSEKPRLSNQFSQTMGVMIFDSYCIQAESRYGRHEGRYILHILGAPRSKIIGQKFLYLASIQLHSFSNKIPANVIQDFIERIQNSNGIIAQVSEGFVWYYATSPAAIRVWQIAGLEKNGTCYSQKDRFIQGLLKSSTQTQPSFYCLERYNGVRESQMGLAIWSGRQHIRLATLPIQSYTSYDDCFYDLPRIEYNLKNRNDNIFIRNLGVVCVSAMGNLDPKYRYEAKTIEQLK
jgi:hypothetical protein